MTRLIIFDFDGVVADSEWLANGVLAELMTELGRPMTVHEAIAAFMGKRASDVVAAVSALSGRPAAVTLADEIQARTLERFRRELAEVPGCRAYIEGFPSLKRCIASSSSPERLAACLDLLRLGEVFGGHVFSAAHVARGKPHPDIFLHAAARMQVQPADALVIEDSESGVRGAVAAGMTVIGLLAGAHVGDGHGERLRHAGAHALAESYEDAAQLTRAWLAGAMVSSPGASSG